MTPPPLEQGSHKQDSAGAAGLGSKPESVEVVPDPNAPFFKLFDQVIRGREALLPEIFTGPNLWLWIRRFLVAIVVLSAFYGVTMGTSSFSNGFGRGLLQVIASAIKVPLLYLLSLAVCLPVLYVVLALMGVRAGFGQTMGMILLAVTFNAVLLASCAPIALFFTITGASYSFIKLLHVAVFAFSGAWAMVTLWQGLQLLCEKSDLYPRKAVQILQVWILVFGFVGTQMAWSLRPFVGSPNQEFQLFRAQEGNFYQAVWRSFTGFAQGDD